MDKISLQDFLKMLHRVDQNHLICGVNVELSFFNAPRLRICYSSKKLGEGFDTAGYDSYRLSTPDSIHLQTVTNILRDYAIILEAWIRTTSAPSDDEAFEEFDDTDN